MSDVSTVAAFQTAVTQSQVQSAVALRVWKLVQQANQQTADLVAQTVEAVAQTMEVGAGSVSGALDLRA